MTGDVRNRVYVDYRQLQFLCLFASWLFCSVVVPSSAALVGRVGVGWIGAVANFAALASQVYSSVALAALNPVTDPTRRMADWLMTRIVLASGGAGLVAGGAAYAATRNELLMIDATFFVWAASMSVVIISRKSRAWPTAYGTLVFLASAVQAAAIGVAVGGWLHGGISLLFTMTSMALPAAIYPVRVIAKAP